MENSSKKACPALRELRMMAATLNQVLEPKGLRVRPVAVEAGWLGPSGKWVAKLWLEWRRTPYWDGCDTLAQGEWRDSPDETWESLLEAWGRFPGRDERGAWIPGAGSLEELCLKLEFAGE